jgi:ADP-heptose:LPS heptosyltransferase
MKRYGKILIVNLGGIGDLLLCAPALEGISQGNPHAAIDLLCVERVRQLGLDLGVFRSVFTPGSGPLGLAALGLRLRRQRYDLAVNMRTLATDAGARKMRLLFSVIHPAMSAGRDTDGRGNFFDIRLPENEPGRMHELDYDLGMCRLLGLELPPLRLSVQPGKAREQRVRELLSARGIGANEPFVAVNPGGMASRQWPEGNFSAAMRMVRETFPCRFALIGSRQEKALCRRLSEETGAADLCGDLDVMETAALLSACRLFITNDTGPMHLAAWLKVPMVAIFGPGQLVRFDPRRLSPAACVLYKPAACAPCGKKTCADLRCLTAITPEKTARAALRVLSGKEAS